MPSMPLQGHGGSRLSHPHAQPPDWWCFDLTAPHRSHPLPAWCKSPAVRSRTASSRSSSSNISGSNGGGGGGGSGSGRLGAPSLTNPQEPKTAAAPPSSKHRMLLLLPVLLGTVSMLCCSVYSLYCIAEQHACTLQLDGSSANGHDM
jgi:hypothetical protein